MVRSAPDDERTDHQTHHDRAQRKRNGERDVNTQRQAHPCKRLYLSRSELLETAC